MAQKTIARSIDCCGIGLHSGRHINLTLHPGAVGDGIIFVRRDQQNTQLAAHWRHVRDTRLCTQLGNEQGVTVGTVEHLLAACHGLEIDNLVVELDGPEVPILDGSAVLWTALLHEAGIVRQAARRQAIQVLRPVVVMEDDKVAALRPASVRRFTVRIQFDSPVIGNQRFRWDMGTAAFDADLAPARTFGFLEEADALRARGLIRGGSLDNAVVIANQQVMNPTGLRFDDEFARHKTLDCIGDMYLAGAPILGHCYGYKPGHHMNHLLLQNLFADPANWALVELDNASQPLPATALAVSA